MRKPFGPTSLLLAVAAPCLLSGPFSWAQDRAPSEARFDSAVLPAGGVVYEAKTASARGARKASPGWSTKPPQEVLERAGVQIEDGPPAPPPGARQQGGRPGPGWSTKPPQEVLERAGVQIEDGPPAPPPGARRQGRPSPGWSTKPPQEVLEAQGVRIEDGPPAPTPAARQQGRPSPGWSDKPPQEVLERAGVQIVDGPPASTPGARQRGGRPGPGWSTKPPQEVLERQGGLFRPAGMSQSAPGVVESAPESLDNYAPPENWSGSGMPANDGTDQACNYAEIDYLLWNFTGARAPALITTNPAGTRLADAGLLSNPSTRVVYGNSNFGDWAQNGIQARFGRWLDDSQFSRWELNGFYLFSRSEKYHRTTRDGSPILGRPFTDATTGEPNSQLLSYPGVADSTVDGRYRRSFWGVSPLAFMCLSRDCDRWRELFFGYQFFRYQDSLKIRENLIVAQDGLVVPGTRFIVEDYFSATNDYHLFPVGLSFSGQNDDWRWNLRGSIGLGFVYQQVKINGRTEVIVPGDTTQVYRGGLLALSSNIGEYSRTRFAWAPQLSANLARRLSDHAWINVGYTLIYLSDVAYAVKQVDTTINPNLLPPEIGGGPRRPAFHFRSDDALVHGLNVGLIFDY